MECSEGGLSLQAESETMGGGRGGTLNEGERGLPGLNSELGPAPLSRNANACGKYRGQV